MCGWIGSGWALGIFDESIDLHPLSSSTHSAYFFHHQPLAGFIPFIICLAVHRRPINIPPVNTVYIFKAVKPTLKRAESDIQVDHQIFIDHGAYT